VEGNLKGTRGREHIGESRLSSSKGTEKFTVPKKMGGRGWLSRGETFPPNEKNGLKENMVGW